MFERGFQQHEIGIALSFYNDTETITESAGKNDKIIPITYGVR
jgi:hypothetical protein